MNYIGSKKKLTEWIFSIILKGKDPQQLTFLDGCSGSGIVSKSAIQLGFKKVISNDLLSFPQHLITAEVALTPEEYQEAQEKISTLNNLSGISGFFFQNYSESAGRLYFTDQNAQKIDAIRQAIESENNSKIKSYLLAALLHASTAVSNTTGVQCSFLKHFQERAKKELHLENISCLCRPEVLTTYNSDILALLKAKKTQEDILYCDPPYNNRQYNSNYHLFETLIKNDNPKIFGKTGLRDGSQTKSKFCSKSECLEFLKNIVQATVAPEIYISYNSDGLLSLEDFKTLGKITVEQKEYKRYKSDAAATRTYNNDTLNEYLIKITK